MFSPNKVTGNEKINVSFKFRPSDWYIGVECTEQVGFNAQNAHRQAFNALMRELTDCGLEWCSCQRNTIPIFGTTTNSGTAT